MDRALCDDFIGIGSIKLKLTLPDNHWFAPFWQPSANYSLPVFRPEIINGKAQARRFLGGAKFW